MSAEDDPLVGRTLEGRFLIQAPLGHGGMGVVYVAEDVQLRRRCALKVLRPEFAGERDHVDRFLREAQTIARLSHENIVNIYSMGRDPSGAVFFAMELLDGEDLAKRLRDDSRPVQWRQICEWAIQIAHAVEAVHQAGLVHRDLKPGNVFLARRRNGSEFVKLLDFGIVRAEDSDITMTGAAIGTPNYMSPEQLQGLSVDHRSDIYSFGVLLFRALTGVLPFRGEPLQVAMMHIHTPAPTLTATAPERELPEGLEALVLTALEKAPDDRFPSMEVMAAALEEVLARSAPRVAAAGVTTSPVAAVPGGSADSTLPGPIGDAGGPEDGSRTMPRLPAGGPSAVPDARSRWRTAPLFVTTALLAGVGLLAIFVAVRLLDQDSSPPAAAPSGSDYTASVQIRQPAAVTSPTASPSPPPREPTVADVPAPVAPTSPAPESGPPAEASPPDAPPGATSASKPRTPSKSPTKSTRTVDPLVDMAGRARACRRTHDAVGGPSIAVDYAIASDGTVARAVPAQKDELGKCLAEAVRQTMFPAKLVLGRRVEL